MLPINSALFFSSLSSYILFLNHVLPFLHICIVGSSSGWSHHLAFGFLHRSTDRTIRFMTSSLTSWLDLSTFTSTRRSLRRWPVGWAARYLILRQPTGRIVCRFIASYAGGSPDKLGTSSADSLVGLLRFANAACHVWYQGFPCCLDQGANLGWHVRGFDKYIYCTNLVLSTFRFLHVLLLDIIKFYSRCLVLSAGTSSFTLNSLILL